MQVNSVSSQPVQKFGHRLTQREYLEGFAQLNDKDLQTLAAIKASNDVNDKKHRRISNAIFYSIPLAAGLDSAVKTLAKNPKMLRGNKLAAFAGTALSWAGAFAGIDLVFAGKRKLEQSNKAARGFAQEHPILSTIGGFAAAIGALALGSKGISKLKSKLLSNTVVRNEIFRNFVENSKKLNESRILNTAAEILKQVPSPIKNFGKGVIAYGPLLLVVGSITHSINHSNAKTKQVYKNYADLKTAQNELRNSLANREISKEVE